MERVVIVICGPTASGKTAVSLDLAKQLNSEIISADSRQVFKNLDIGTAKPTKLELSNVKHHFIDEIEPDAVFNASIFEIDSLKIIEDLLGKGKIPIVAGGSGLYIQALVDGIFDAADSDDDLRKELLHAKETKGVDYLYEELKKVDPVSSAKMLPQNWKRVIRALEVYKITGRPIWQVQSEYNRNINIKFIQYGLNWDRELLYDRINKRVDVMIEQGLIEETRKVLNMGYDKKLNALNTVGYKEIISAFDGEIEMETAIDLIKRNTRRFAKRQMTWFRRDERINWFLIKRQDDLMDIAGKIYMDVKGKF